MFGTQSRRSGLMYLDEIWLKAGLLTELKHTKRFILEKFYPVESSTN